MSTDIVESLRWRAQRQHVYDLQVVLRLHEEAASEIERLRGLVAYQSRMTVNVAKELGCSPDNEVIQATIRERTAEIEQQRAEITELTQTVEARARDCRIADESHRLACREIEHQRATIADLREALREIQDEATRPKSSPAHLRRLIAIQVAKLKQPAALTPAAAEQEGR